MPIIKWSEYLLLGLPELDQHHKHLVELLNGAYDDFRDGNNLLSSVIDELLSYSSQHFPYEESLMAEASYPNFAEHKVEHALFTSRVLEAQNNSCQNINTTIELLWFLCSWVTHHTRETDADFVRFLNSRMCNG